MKHDGRNLLRSFTSVVLVSLLAVSIPGLGLAGVTPAGTSISVSSDPEGAMVYLDGVAQGLTPLELDIVDEGDHRVTILKDGFIENSQLVTVEPGKTKVVNVSLTESAEARYTIQTSSDEGGGSKWPLILGIGGGAAVAAYFLLRDTNEPPSAGTISVAPTTPGLVSVTNFTFTSNASDPDGDSLTYSWDFGDGASGSGQSTSHTYQAAGSFNVTLTVSDGEESATAASSAVVRSLTGNWSGDILGVLPFGVDLSQNGTGLGGTFRSLGDTGSIDGRVSAPNNVRFSVTIPGFQPFTLAGTVDETLDRITGSVTGSGFTGQPFTMRR